ncbi:MAG: S8 family serine peptidase [Phaeodactylibacter sp.]|nr:S8 family serine peptidase [Phaeodactylibacter sp.]
MKKHLSSLFCLFFLFLLAQPRSLSAQDSDQPVVAPGLHLALEEKPEAFHSVMMLLSDRIDPRALEEELRRRKASLQERTYEVITALQAKAAATQPAMLEKLNSSRYVKKESIRPFWITNVIFFEARREAIEALSKDPAVGRLDINREIMIPDEEAEVEESEALQNNREPGLAAIGAPEMWAMGYTGHGRKVLIVDSGHDIFHPAVHNNFAWHYVPMNQAWANPGEPYYCSDHGVHVGGTVVGLDRIMEDTIGVAFDALWLGSSHNGCEASGGTALNYVSIYQWAMNPDGDPNTINDMPDVINNSWSYNYPTLSDCFDPTHIAITDAVMAAGIAIIFSASNEGPDPMTIGDPPMNNWDTVRMFAVGWLNGNNPNFPIASGSSRGPTVCGGEGSLLIKPEVSAPGSSVRSSIAGGGYGALSGTSMATPHVTGATALLKEAFPYLPGEELMKALYYSAIDLGAPGEDNDYGMGIINLPAAFNYLVSRGNEPVPPVVAPNDAVLLRSGVRELNCEVSVNPVIEVENDGSETFTSMEISYSLTGAGDTVALVYNWEGEIQPKERRMISLPALESVEGDFLYIVEISKVNGQEDARRFNNRLKKRVRLTADENFTTSVIDGLTTCRNSNARVQVSAESNQKVRWYGLPEGGSQLAEGASALIPVGEEPVIVYAEVSPQVKVGRQDNADNTFQYSNEQQGIVFDVHTPMTIKSVKVYAEEGGSRLLNLVHPDETAYTKVVPIVAGEQRIELDWKIEEPGEGYSLKLRAGKPLGFNIGGTAYPYTVENVVSLRRSTVGLPFYYYFYDWEVEYPYYCGRVALNIDVAEGSGPQVAFSPSETTIDLSSGLNEVSFTDESDGGASWLWDFGDGTTSTLQNPVHAYSDTGFYQVILTVSGPEGCASSVSGTVTVTETPVTGVTEPLGEEAMVAFPNPAQDVLYLAFQLEKPAIADYCLSSLLGRPVLRGEAQVSGQETVEVPLDELPAGAYLLVVNIDGQRLVQRVVKSR